MLHMLRSGPGTTLKFSPVQQLRQLFWVDLPLLPFESARAVVSCTIALNRRASRAAAMIGIYGHSDSMTEITCEPAEEHGRSVRRRTRRYSHRRSAGPTQLRQSRLQVWVVAAPKREVDAELRIELCELVQANKLIHPSCTRSDIERHSQLMS